MKHGYGRSARDRPRSSFHRWVRAGVYPEDWACGDVGLTHFNETEEAKGELPPAVAFHLRKAPRSTMASTRLEAHDLRLTN